MSCRLCDGRDIPEAVRAIINSILDYAESQSKTFTKTIFIQTCPCPFRDGNQEIGEPSRPPTSMPLECSPESEELLPPTQGQMDVRVPRPSMITTLREGWRTKPNELSFLGLDDMKTGISGV